MAATTPVPNITIFGSLNMDLVTYTPRMPRAGETLTASAFTTGLGGKGANQAVACAKLSRPRGDGGSGGDSGATAVVRMVGAVGDDAYGAQLKAGLAGFGVDAAAVTALAAGEGESEHTGVAVITVEEDSGENRILVVPGANRTLRAEQLLAQLGGDGTLPPPPDLLIMQLEIPLETVLEALDLAARRGIPVLLNPAPVQVIPERHYGAVAHLVVNETEAALLAGADVAELESEAGLAAAAELFRARGAQIVVITLGGKGAYYAGADGRSGLVPAEKAAVVDTTAAGDTFIGAYALEVVSGRFDLEQAVRKANRAAARTVERKGASESIPWLDELS